MQHLLYGYRGEAGHGSVGAGDDFAPHRPGADPGGVGQGAAFAVEAAVEHEWRKIFRVADQAEDFVEVALHVAVDAWGGGVGQGRERIVVGHG